MTKTQIANIALAKFREGRITNIESDTDSVAVVMNDQYDHALELLLEEHRWNFAGKRVTLTKLQDKPPFGWNFQYALPSDCIRLKDVNGEDVESSSRLFTIEGRNLLSNDDVVTITYVAEIADTNLFSPSFVESLAFKLASITCGRLTGDTDLAIALDKQYNYALAKAIHNDTKSAGSRDTNLMNRLMGSSAILGGGANYSSRGTSSPSSSGGSVSAHKHELTDFLKTSATDGQTIVWNDTEGKWEAGDAASGGDVSTDAIFDAAGDIVVGTGADTAAKLPIGAANEVLKSNGTTAVWGSVGGTGDVVGDATSVDNAITRFNGTGGKTIQNSGASIDDSGNLTANNFTGTSSGANTGDQDLSTYQVKPTEGAFVNGDKTKLDGIEASADITDTTNVTAAGALMDSEVTNLAQVKAFSSADYAPALGVDDNYVTDAEKVVIGNTSGTNTGDQDLSTYQLKPTEGAFVDGDKTKLDGIEALADVTDETNVVSSLSGATITDAGVPASDDKVLIQDTSDSNNLKYVDISDLPSGGGGGASVSVSDTAPSSPSAGDLWFDSSKAKMYVYYNDGNSNQWVSVTSGLPTPDSKTGWMDYNDSTGSFTVVADTWTNVPNNGAGSFTNKTFKPPSVTEVLDTTTGHLDFSDLPLGSEISLRNDLTIVPNSNNALLQMRYVLGTGANEYALNFLSDRLDSGSGVIYQKVSTFPIYMGDTNTKNNAGKLQIKLSVAGTVTNNGVYASIQLY